MNHHVRMTGIVGLASIVHLQGNLNQQYWISILTLTEVDQKRVWSFVLISSCS